MFCTNSFSFLKVLVKVVFSKLKTFFMIWQHWNELGGAGSHRCLALLVDPPGEVPAPQACMQIQSLMYIINISPGGKQILSSISIFSVKTAYITQYIKLSLNHSSFVHKSISQQYFIIISLTTTYSWFTGRMC